MFDDRKVCRLRNSMPTYDHKYADICRMRNREYADLTCHIEFLVANDTTVENVATR